MVSLEVVKSIFHPLLLDWETMVLPFLLNLGSQLSLSVCFLSGTSFSLNLKVAETWFSLFFKIWDAWFSLFLALFSSYLLLVFSFL